MWQDSAYYRRCGDACVSLWEACNGTCPLGSFLCGSSLCQPDSWAAYYYSCGTSCHYSSQPCQVSVSPTTGQRITTAAGPAVTTAASRARSVSVLLQLRDQRHLKHGHWPQWPALPGQWRLCITVQYSKFQIIQIAIRFNLLHFRCSSHIG